MSMKKTATFSEFLFLSVLLSSCFASLVVVGANTTHPDEVQALRDIAKTIQKNWNFDVDPCSGDPSWTTFTPFNDKDMINNVTCDFGDDKLYHVVGIAVLGNRLSGQIPEELANITSLRILILESNNFSGKLPPKLGYLPFMEKLQLSSNNFTGELPETFSRLTTLKDVDIQGSGLGGPFPSSGFSSLQNLTGLILRNCNINDTIQDYVGNLKKLEVLDLSYNKLSGKIPDTFGGLSDVDNIYLTGNFLTGEWNKLSAKKNLDLSYNNFNSDDNRAPECTDSNTNLFASFLKENNSGPISCTKTIECSERSCCGLWSW